MFNESVPVTFEGGIHNGTLDALYPYGAHGLRINGLDPGDWDNWQHLQNQYPAHGDVTKPVEISVDHPDEQTARDLHTIAKHTIFEGRNLWPGRQVPPERFNQAANAVRRKVGLPEEEGNIMPTSTYVRDETTDMTTAAMQKGSPYPENSEENAPDHSAPGHHLPKKVNDIYNALMRDHPEYGKEKAMRIAWGQSGEKHEAASKWQVVAEVDEEEEEQQEEDDQKKDFNERNEDAIWRRYEDRRPKRPRTAAMTKHACEMCGCDSEECLCSKEKPCGHSGCKLAKESKVAATDDDDYFYMVGDNAGRPLCKDCAKEYDGPKDKKWTVGDDPYCSSCHNRLQKEGRTFVSKWQVVALGELQQPGGVGATQEYNPVVDGPNPQGVNTDNATNSPEQEVALETWVNMAVDMINRGEEDSAVLAQLAHDGCPEPEQVLQRAKQQPNQSPLQDELGQDPFNAPPADDPAQTGQMQGLSQQPPQVTSRVRIAGTTLTGTLVERWEDLWGSGMCKVALDDGGTMNVAPEAVQSFEEDTVHPVSQIQEFIDSLPVVEPTRPNIEARLTNLELVRQAVRSTISKVGFSDKVKLQEMDRWAEGQSDYLKDCLSGVEVAPTKIASYESFAPKANGPVPGYTGNVREAAMIWASEGPWTDEEAWVDKADLHYAAIHYAETHNLSGEQLNAFVKSAEEYVENHRVVRTEEFSDEPETDNDGPAEGLFL